MSLRSFEAKSVLVGSNYMPGISMTIESNYNFEKSGKGKFTTKEIVTKDSKPEYTFTFDYDITWTTDKDGKGDFISMKYSKGQITNLDGVEKLKVEQDAHKRINTTNGFTDTLYFKVQDHQTLVCQIWGRPDKFKMNRE